MWKVIYVTSNAQLAEKIQQRLTEDGFLVQLKTRLAKEIEIRVPASEVQEAQEMLNIFLHQS